MTRREAIEKLKSKLDGHTDTSYEWAETVRMAISALENEMPTTEEEMAFPKNWHTFLDYYSFKDKDEVYTNGSYLIQKLRAEQALEHYVDGVIDNVLKTIETSVEAVIAVECLSANSVFKDESRVGAVARFGRSMIRNLQTAVEALKGGAE